MSLVFKTRSDARNCELSYLVGDDDEGVAAVFRSRPDCDIYIDMAREAAWPITHIFETPYSCRSGQRFARAGARLDSARFLRATEGGAEYKIRGRENKDGDRFIWRSARHRAHTPATRLSTSYCGGCRSRMSVGNSDRRFAFVSSAGRPDCVGENTRRTGRATISYAAEILSQDA